MLQEPKLKGINLPKHMNVRKLSPFAKDRLARAERLNEEDRMSLAKRRVECERRLQEASRETKTEKSRGGDDRAKRKDGGEESDRSVERESGVNKHTKVSNPFEIATDAKSNTGDSRDSVQTVIRLT